MARQMKDSGFAWIGKIPVDWNIQKVKTAFYRSKEEAHIDDPVVLSLARSGVKVRDISTNEGQLAESYYNYNPVVAGDLLLNPMDLYSGANCSVSNVEGVISPAYINLRTRGDYSPNFYDYYFKTQYWAMALFAHGKGVSFDNRWTLSPNDLFNYAIPVPSYEEQLKIASFLDEKCSEIDAVIAKTQATIEEYKKLKQSIITEAVTKGIRGDRPMKDSGFEWIGEIPTDWKMLKITRLLDYSVPYPIGDGDHGLISPSDYTDSGVPYLRVQNLGFGTPLNHDGLVYISEETNEKIKGSTLRPYDVLFAKTGGTIGKTGIIPPTMPIANTTSHIGKITVSPLYNPKWVLYVLSSAIGYRQFWEIALQKTTRPELSILEIKSIKLTVPSSKKEQDEIVEYLDQKCSELDTLIEKKTALLEEMETYKKSVIYEYVTGKKEVL